MYLAAALFLILSESIAEGLYDNGKKTLSGVIEFIKLVVTTMVIFAWLNCIYPKGIIWQPAYYWTILAGYVLLRFAIFDLVYNLIRGLLPFFIGETKLSDKLLRKFFSWTKFPSDHFLFMVKLISLAVGLTWLLK
jgi:uncharacterized membrane protein